MNRSWWLVFGLCVACSGGSGETDGGTDAGPSLDAADGGASGGATVTGSLNGQTMSPAYATAVSGFGQPGNQQILIVIGNRPDLCALMQAYADNPMQRHANLFEIGLMLGVANSPVSVTPGTYTMAGNPNELTPGFDSYDSACVDNGGIASGGTVTLTSVGAAYVGTFDVPFPAGTVSGSFDAPLCNLVAPEGGVPTSDGGMTCVP